MSKNEYADKDFEKFLKETKGKEDMDKKPDESFEDGYDGNICLFFMEVLKEKLVALDTSMKTAALVYEKLQKGSSLATKYEGYMENLIKISIETVKEFDNLMGD